MSRLAQIFQVFGPPGSGVTTLGTAAAEALHIEFADMDTFHWHLTEPPYELVRCPEEKLSLFRELLRAREYVLVAGSLTEWAKPISHLVHASVFLCCPVEVRIRRIVDREFSRHGERIAKGGLMYERHRKFLDWAASYDELPESDPRSAMRDTQWYSALSCKKMILDTSVANKKTCCTNIVNFFRTTFNV